MTSEQKREITDPPIVEPREFLSRPFKRLEVGELAQPPDVELLKWFPTLPDESGLVYQEPRWFVIKASYFGVPSWIMPQNSDILLHSHPSYEIMCDERGGPFERFHKYFGEHDESLPSTRDFGNCSAKAKNFIVSPKGITQYWPVFSEGGNCHLDVRELERRLRESQGLEEYLRSLKEICARFQVYPWEELDDEKLAILFYRGIGVA